MPIDVIQGSFSAEAVRRLQSTIPSAPASPQAGSPHAIMAAQAAMRRTVVQTRGAAQTLLVPSNVIISERNGQRLPESVQLKMESLLGAKFSDVQVHTGPEAASLGAYAFTRGTHLYFAPGQYAPHTPVGQRLLAHELTHVVQQRAGRVRNPLGRGTAIVQDHSLEAEAERNGLRALAFSTPAQPRPSSTPAPSAPAAKSCGCGCGGSCSTPRRRPTTKRRSLLRRTVQRAIIQRASADVMPMGPTSTFVNGKRKNAPRDAKRSRLTKRQQTQHFSSASSGKKKKDDCKGASPGKGGWRKKMWDGITRPSWDGNANQIPLGQVCEEPGCANLATAVDHVEPHKTYIGNQVDQQVFCDGQCHFLGMSMADVSAAYNDGDNLRYVCNNHNSVKASKDKKNPENQPDPPTPIGPCPNPGNCGVYPCQAHVCL